MQTLMHARYRDGRALGDEEITGILLTVLFAGQHTRRRALELDGARTRGRAVEPRTRTRRDARCLRRTGAMSRASLKRQVALEHTVRECERPAPAADTAHPQGAQAPDLQRSRRARRDARDGVSGGLAPVAGRVRRSRAFLSRAVRAPGLRGQAAPLCAHRFRRRQAPVHGEELRHPAVESDLDGAARSFRFRP